MTIDLQTEYEAYCDQLPQMLTRHDGEYVVIRGTQPVHYSSTYEDALGWAYESFGLDRFFIKKVAMDQAVAHFTRDLGPCRP